MTKAMWIGCAAIVAVAWSWRASAQATYAVDPAAGFGAAREMVTHFQESATGPTALTVIDPAAKVLAVYHISRETGAISLKSVRNIDWDLRLEVLNSADPTPDEIRKSFERQ